MQLRRLVKGKIIPKEEIRRQRNKMTERRQEFTPISSNQVKVPLAPGRGLSSWMR